MVSLPAAAYSAQIVTLPNIPELYDENFLDILIPPKQDDVVMEEDRPATVQNPMMDALKSTAHQTFTQNMAPAYSSTLSATLDAFQGLSRYSSGPVLENHLDNAWKEDPALALRIIWCLRSIHDGKGEKEAFYRAFGWLFDHHPRTAILNLPFLIKPVCTTPKKKREQESKAHGYWKDLLNILALATVDEFSSFSTFLHSPRTKATAPPRPEKRVKHSQEVVAAHIEAARLHNEQNKADATRKRDTVRAQHHERLVGKLVQPKYRALYIAVSRLFADRLGEDIRILDEIDGLAPGVDRIPYYKKISLAGKWAPTPHGSHDRVTNISTAISLLLHHSNTPAGFPSALRTPLEPKEEALILRSFFQRWILRPLRQVSLCPEPLMSANRWTDIRYNRVPSVCMKNNTELFYKHDPDGFGNYLISVETGKKKISGATLLPYELVAQAYSCGYDSAWDIPNSKYPKLQEFKKNLAETKSRVVEAQWKTLIKNLQESGSIENSLAICDVSGSMGSMDTIARKGVRRRPPPILTAISLSLVLSYLSKPPFNAGFITFSADPKFVQLDLTKPLFDTITTLRDADWGMNTDLNAVFLKLLLPLAVKNSVKPEDMIKRLFIFSDMQFDSAQGTSSNPTGWATNYDVIEKAYRDAGYEVPQIVYWDLAGQAQENTFEVEADRTGVAMMNGFSPALLKAFMGESELEDVEEWEKVGKNGEVVEKDEFNPVNVMKKALMKKSFDGLVVVD